MEWATAGGSIRQRRIVAALIVSSEARLSSGGAYKIREASLSAKEGSGSGCALPHRPPCLQHRPVKQKTAFRGGRRLTSTVTAKADINVAGQCRFPTQALSSTNNIEPLPQTPLLFKIVVGF